MHPQINPERRRKLTQLFAIAFVIDLITTAAEAPFFVFILELAPVKELIETFVSTLIAGHTLRLDFWDRLIGFLPIPGVTAVTIAVTREFLFGPKKMRQLD